MSRQVGVIARFEFAEGQQAAAQEFLAAGQLIVEGQPSGTRWYAYRLGPTTYGAFAVFASEVDREALLAAGGPKSARDNAGLFATPPSFEKCDIVAARDERWAHPG